MLDRFKDAKSTMMECWNNRFNGRETRERKTTPQLAPQACSRVIHFLDRVQLLYRMGAVSYVNFPL
jgi:hypothetical protein